MPRYSGRFRGPELERHESIIRSFDGSLLRRLPHPRGPWNARGFRQVSHVAFIRWRGDVVRNWIRRIRNRAFVSRR